MPALIHSSTAADPGVGDRLPEPVRIDAPAGSGRPGVPGDLYQHAGRSGGVPRDVQEKAI